jgi:hypothetical protein
MYEAITPPVERQQELLSTYKYNVLYIISHHIHPDFKSEYVLEEEPSTLWATLHSHYEQQKNVILLEVNHEWTHLRLYDYKSIRDYNHDVQKICVNCDFVKKNLPMKIRLRRLTTILPPKAPGHRHRSRGHMPVTDWFSTKTFVNHESL